jgi:hypothetical protein
MLGIVDWFVPQNRSKVAVCGGALRLLELRYVDVLIQKLVSIFNATQNIGKGEMDEPKMCSVCSALRLDLACMGKEESPMEYCSDKKSL